MVHGQNWPVHGQVTIALVGVATSPIHPIADDRGTFNYVINQDHEFFAAGCRLAPTRSGSPTPQAAAPRPGSP